MHLHDEVLTVLQIATHMNCSKQHIYHAISGTVAGVSPLPVIKLGRRLLVRRSTFEEWKRSNERSLASQK